MTTLLAIDPGAMSGLATFEDGRLTGAWALEPRIKILTDIAFDVVVIECPNRVFGQARPQDIMKLSRIVGRYEERYPFAQHLVTPRDWKGTVDGDIMTNRIKAALTPAEHVICRSAYRPYDHNMLDAVGLGKWALRQPWMRARKS